MSNTPITNKQTKNYPQGSGSEYHQEHGSHVPDYGANNIDPNAKGLRKNTNK